jgi:hypothetical protein
MLKDSQDLACLAKLDRELGRNPGFAPVLREIREAADVYAIDPLPEGIEIAPAGASGTAPVPTLAAGRCRMKLFRPREEKERLCAFFFKKSNIAGSRDRFSYGAVEFLPDRLVPQDVRTWLDWLSSGLDPARRPANLKRAFLYTIPE